MSVAKLILHRLKMSYNNPKYKKVKLSKTHSYKADKHRKNHIAHVLRNDPRRFRILSFAQALAAKKIQRHYRVYKEYKIEREKIRFEQAK